MIIALLISQVINLNTFKYSHKTIDFLIVKKYHVYILRFHYMIIRISNKATRLILTSKD